MEEVVKINEKDLKVKMWNGQKVVTFADIDKVHERVEGTAKRNFNDNKKHLIIDEDYFLVKPADVQKYEKRTLGFEVPNRGLTLLTESGYLLLVKSFSDDLAWKVQRDLVNSYFKLKELAPQSNEVMAIKQDLSVLFVQINSMESMLEEQTEAFLQTKEQLDKVMSNMTLTTVQQNKIHTEAKNRVNYLLGGAHSQNYKDNSRMYFINLWNGLKSHFECGSHWQDLNPACYDKALEYIQKWTYND